MKIGVVTASYPRIDGEHAGSFVAGHVAAMRTAGHAVDVIGAHTIASTLFYGGGAPDALERGGVRTAVEAARFSIRLTREVARRAADWDLVIAHWLAPSALAALVGTLGVRSPSAPPPSAPPRSSRLLSMAARLATPRAASPALPILAIAHGGDIHTLRRLHLLAPTLHALHARDIKLAFVSRELREIARAAAPRLSTWLDEALVQPMGIDVARFAALPRTPRPGRVLVVGRLVPVKGVDVAIRALAHLRARVELVIAGAGPEHARLAELAARESACDSVRFLGAVDASTRDRLLSEAACVVIPSRVLANGRSEGTPMIALEALAARVPVIAADVGGLRDLPGLLRVRSDDPRALAAAIDAVLANPPQLGGGPPARNTLDWDVVAAALFDRALGQTPSLKEARSSSAAPAQDQRGAANAQVREAALE